MCQSLEEWSGDAEGPGEVNLSFTNYKSVLCTLEFYSGKVPAD